MTELALPAGSLQTALTAFSNGADAVYFGLREFSARKGAVNFSLEDLSKIRRYALDHGRKIYVTVNTLIDDNAMERVLPLLDALDFYGNDGVIIQDLGLAEIMRKHYPSLKMHGSTQLAVHTVEGVREMQDLGFERVVLSRELTLDEIRSIREKCRDIELKVFIHGALCYGFSGLCSASFLKCGRSANGGECAQICRSWFRNSRTGEKGYFFSMEDLAVREELKTLRDMGIDSVKVEGRLKSPEYTAACARYYRAVLDDRPVTKEDSNALSTTFLRRNGDGYLHYRPNRPSLLSGDWPGHTGLYLGRIMDERGSDCFLETDERLENHDGIQYFVKDDSGLTDAVKTSASIKSRTPGGYILRKDYKERLLGKEIYKISDSTKKEKTPSENIPLFRKSVDIAVTLRPDSIEAESLGKRVSAAVKTEESEKKRDMRETLERVFRESGTSPWTLGNLTFNNLSLLDYPFVQPSLLKEFRRLVYSSLPEPEMKTPELYTPEGVTDSFTLPPRKELEGDLPWSMEGKEIDGRTYFTFPPVTFNEERLWSDMLTSVGGRKNVTIGLNNISQVRFAKAHPEYDYFADIYLYLSNRYTLSLLREEVPTLKAGYLWFERDSFSGTWPFEPTKADYEPPYFISRTCFRHDALGLSCTGCTKRENYALSQGDEKYTVKVRNCLTLLVRD